MANLHRAFHFPPFSLRLLPWVVGAACAGVLSAHAQTTKVAAANLKEVVISGSRNEQAADELPMTMDVVNAKDIEEGQIRDIRDVVKDIPNVSVRRSPARFTAAGASTGRDANSGFNIRGLEGNRVLMLVDGIRLPQSYVFGATAFGRDSVSMDLIKQVEIIKGPASVLYGSDGIAGLVNFITYEPSDFLKAGKTLGGKAAIGYSGDDQGKAVSVTLAGRASDVMDWQISATANRANELSNLGQNNALNTDRTAPNPQIDTGQSLLAKVVIKPSASQKHTLSFEHVDKKSDYELLSARAKKPFTGSATAIAGAILQTNATNTSDRNRLTWNARFKLDAGLADNLQAVLSYQSAKSRSFIFEDRNTAADRTRDTTFAEQTWQVSAQADKTIRLSADWSQKLTYGVDYTQASITNLVDGTIPPLGEAFPLKRFPDTVESTTALYAQDEFIGGNWSITPGVRLDNFNIKPSTTGFPAAVVSPSGSAVSPKLGVLYRATPQWSVFGNYASGFRAPNAGQVNAFFENLSSFYKTIPNGALKPEKSKNFELGVRGSLDSLSLEAAVFSSKFTDLIEDRRQVSGAGTAANPTVFQSVNIDNATISGFEVKGSMDWGKVGVGKLSTPFSYGQSRGTVNNTGLPLDTIDPAKLNLGVRFETAAWDLRLNAIHHAAKKLSDIGTKSLPTTPATNPVPQQFAPPASTTFDLSGQWRFSKTTRLNASIVNLTNQKYWNWSDVRSVAATAVSLDAYTQPGRKFNVSLVTDF